MLAVMHTHPYSGQWTPSSADANYLNKTPGISTLFVFGEKGVGMGTTQYPGGYCMDYIGPLGNLLNGSIDLVQKIPK